MWTCRQSPVKESLTILAAPSEVVSCKCKEYHLHGGWIFPHLHSAVQVRKEKAYH